MSTTILYPALDRLTESEAEFVMPQTSTGGSVSIPRGLWEDSGRPMNVAVIVGAETDDVLKAHAEVEREKRSRDRAWEGASDGGRLG